MRFHSGVLFVSPDLDLPCFQCVVHVRMRKVKRHYRRGLSAALWTNIVLLAK